MKKVVPTLVVDPVRRYWFAQSEPVALHCHHYNCFLQHSMESAADFVDVPALLRDSAEEVAFAELA